MRSECGRVISGILHWAETAGAGMILKVWSVGEGGSGGLRIEVGVGSGVGGLGVGGSCDEADTSAGSVV